MLLRESPLREERFVKKKLRLLKNFCSVAENFIAWQLFQRYGILLYTPGMFFSSFFLPKNLHFVSCFFLPDSWTWFLLLVSFLVSFEDFRFTFTSPPRAFVPSLSLTNLQLVKLGGKLPS